MQDEIKQDPPPEPPRVIADYGGRRKVFDRRIKPCEPDDADRRSGQDRRSGFDRRSACHDQSQKRVETRNDFNLNSE